MKNLKYEDLVITPATKFTKAPTLAKRKTRPYKAFSVYIREDGTSVRYKGRVATLNASLKLAQEASLRFGVAEIRNGLKPVGVYRKGLQVGSLSHS